MNRRHYKQAEGTIFNCALIAVTLSCWRGLVLPVALKQFIRLETAGAQTVHLNTLQIADIQSTAPSNFVDYVLSATSA
jgi:hypothetical protein